MIRVVGAALALLGLLLFFKDTLATRFRWIEDRMPPGEPYGRDGGLFIRIRRWNGLFLLAFGLLLLIGG